MENVTLCHVLKDDTELIGGDKGTSSRKEAMEFSGAPKKVYDLDQMLVAFGGTPGLDAKG